MGTEPSDKSENRDDRPASAFNQVLGANRINEVMKRLNKCENRDGSRSSRHRPAYGSKKKEEVKWQWYSKASQPGQTKPLNGKWENYTDEVSQAIEKVWLM